MTSGLLDLSEVQPGTRRLEGVGVVRRGLARLIDLGVLQLAALAGAAQVFVLPFLLEGVFGPAVYAVIERLVADETAGWSRLWNLVVGLTGLTAMHTLSEGLHGSTIGKRLCGITVISEEGYPAGMKAAFKRSLGFLVDQLFFGLVGAHFIHNDPKAQRVGDSWAGTMVVRLHALEPTARRTGGRFVLASGLGLAAVGAVSLLWYAGLIVHGARAAAADRVEILEVVPLPDQQVRPGERANFSMRVRHDLQSAYRGTVGLFVLDREGFAPVGDRIWVSRGGGTVTLRKRLPVPAEATAPGSFVLNLGIGLYPALNEEAASADAGYDLQMIACDSEPRELCVLRGLKH